MARFILSAFADEIDPRFELQLASLNTLGIEYIELRGVDGRSFVTLSDRELDDIRRRMGIHGIKVWSLGSPLGKVRIDDAESQYALLDRLMEIGDKLGTRNIRMFSFYPVDGEPFEEYEKKVFFHINALTEKASGCGFVLCHENEKAYTAVRRSGSKSSSIRPAAGSESRSITAISSIAACPRRALSIYLKNTSNIIT